MAKQREKQNETSSGAETAERQSFGVLCVLQQEVQGRTRWKIVDAHNAIYFTQSKAVAELAESAMTRGAILSAEYRVDASLNAMILSASITSENAAPPDTPLELRPRVDGFLF